MNKKLCASILLCFLSLAGCQANRSRPDVAPPQVTFLVYVPGREVIQPNPGDVITVDFKDKIKINMLVTSPHAGYGIGETSFSIGSPDVCKGVGAPIKGKLVKDPGNGGQTVKVLSQTFTPYGSKCDSGYLFLTLTTFFDALSLYNAKYLIHGDTETAAWSQKDPQQHASFDFYIQATGSHP